MKNDMSPLISVIIPVYKVEQYLRRCVDSVRGQTYRNLEIILINDGSPDRSGEICDELAKADSRIKVVHKSNGGQSSARNIGLDIATGEYIGFVDSDDWISADMYDALIDLAIKNNADASQIDYIMTNNENIIERNRSLEVNIYNNIDIIQYFMTTTTTTGSYSLCRCIFERNIIESLKFREGKTGEDIDFKYKALYRCKKFVVSNQIKYYYFQSGDSTSSGILNIRAFDLYDAADELWKLTKDENYGTIRFLGEVKKARTAFSLLCRIAYYGIDESQLNRKEIIARLTREHRQNLFILLRAPLPVSRKCAAILLAINEKCLEWPVALVNMMRKV